MKKFASALLAATAIVTSAYADGAVTGGESKTGFYLGGNVGANNTNVKYGYSNVGATATTSGPGSQTSGTIALNSTNAQVNSMQSGKMGALFGLFAGYGMQVSSMYFGGEIYGGLDTAKVTTFNDSGNGVVVTSTTGTVNNNFPLGTASLKRTSYYGFAPRIGGFITPSTMVYARFGIEGGKWTGTYTFSANDGGGSTVAGQSTSQSKNSISFAPGLGIETYFTKNLFLRAEYSYLFGPKVTVVVNTSNSTSWGGASATHTFNVTQQAFKVGVGYKF